jgi:hypothetical protein
MRLGIRVVGEQCAGVEHADTEPWRRCPPKQGLEPLHLLAGIGAMTGVYGCFGQFADREISDHVVVRGVARVRHST